MSEEAYIRQFFNLTDWLNYSEQNLSTDAPSSDRVSCTCRFNWSGVSTKEEAYKLLRVGHPKGLQTMQRILDGIRNTIKLVCPEYEFHNDVVGCSPNVEAFIQGQPEDMLYLHPVEQDAPPSELTLQMEMSFSAGIQPYQAMFGGATVFAAMEALHAQGCNTRILLTHTVKTDDAYWQSAVPVPNNIDLDTLSFLFTHPSVFRVIIFSMMEHEDSDTRQQFRFSVCGSYSRPTVRKNPHANLVLSMARLCQMFTGDEAADIQTAQRIMQVLVDTKFESMQQ